MPTGVLSIQESVGQSNRQENQQTLWFQSSLYCTHQSCSLSSPSWAKHLTAEIHFMRVGRRGDGRDLPNVLVSCMCDQAIYISLCPVSSTGNNQEIISPFELTISFQLSHFLSKSLISISLLTLCVYFSTCTSFNMFSWTWLTNDLRSAFQILG